jgi:hypothetical protein
LQEIAKRRGPAYCVKLETLICFCCCVVISLLLHITKRYGFILINPADSCYSRPCNHRRQVLRESFGYGIGGFIDAYTWKVGLHATVCAFQAGPRIRYTVLSLFWRISFCAPSEVTYGPLLSNCHHQPRSPTLRAEYSHPEIRLTTPVHTMTEGSTARKDHTTRRAANPAILVHTNAIRRLDHYTILPLEQVFLLRTCV